MQQAADVFEETLVLEVAHLFQDEDHLTLVARLQDAQQAAQHRFMSGVRLGGNVHALAHALLEGTDVFLADLIGEIDPYRDQSDDHEAGRTGVQVQLVDNENQDQSGDSRCEAVDEYVDEGLGPVGFKT